MRTNTLKAAFRNARQKRLHKRERRELCRMFKDLGKQMGRTGFGGIV